MKITNNNVDMDKRVIDFVEGLIQLGKDTGLYIQPNLGGTIFITDTRTIPTHEVVALQNDFENKNGISYLTKKYTIE